MNTRKQHLEQARPRTRTTVPSLIPWALALGLIGCAMAPNNGTVVDGPVIGATFAYNGYTNTPNELVTLEVMSQPTLDPSLPSSWVAFGSATTSSSPTYINDPTPLYTWSTTAAPVPTAAVAGRWALGGVLRTRARRANGGVLETFDQPTFLDCVIERYSLGESWQTIGPACAGVSTKSTSRVSGHIGLASTSRTPLDLPATAKPNWLGRKGDISETETVAYYNAWGAPATLAEFKSRYGLGPNDVTATFYNNSDLGLGRDVHCANLANLFIACYVTNYSGVDNTAVFGVNPTTVLNDAVSHQREFASVAMVFSDILGIASVNFVAYNKAGNRVNRAQLDSVGEHQSIPNNCLTCHGISSYYNPATHQIVDPSPTAGAPAARFLAFDPFGYLYSTVPGFTQADQLERFRRLNALVSLTRPAPATVDLITGMYTPNVNTVNATTNASYIPAGWAAMDSSQDGKAIYDGVVKPGCRMCHASASNPSLDFLQGSDWSDKMYRIRSLVCGKTSGTVRGHDMPNAEHVAKRFWATGARALLLSYTQAQQRDPFSPASAPSYPDPNASCDP